MSALGAPRLSGGVAASVLLHGGLIAAIVLLRPAAPPPSPPVYRIDLIAGPVGTPSVGVQDAPAPVEQKAAPPAPPKKATATKPVPAPPKPKAAAKPPKAATPVPAPAKPQATDAAPPKLGGGATGGSGTDVSTVHTVGVEFPYPYYLNNIANRVLTRFGHSNATWTADVQFVIQRDGTVDPNTIRLSAASRSYAFNQQVLAAVEAAADAREFGPLPPGYGEDILPVTIRFSPSFYR